MIKLIERVYDVLSVSYNDGNIKLKWSNASEGGPVHLDESTEHMPQFEVQSVISDHFIDERRDLGTYAEPQFIETNCDIAS